MRNRPVYDVVALIARCGVGAVFLVHGWQKIQVGITATAGAFDAMGVPAPTATAVYATFAELLGGAALILGVALPVAGTLLFLDMAGAFAFLNARHGLLLVDQGRVKNGFELVLVLGLAALLFAAGGGGRLTLDRRLFGRGGRGPHRPDAQAALPAGTATGSGAPPRPSGRGSRGTGGPGSDEPQAVPAGGSGSDADAAGSFDDLSAAVRTASVRRARTGRGTTGTSRDAPVAGVRRTPATNDGPSGKPRKGRPGKDS